MLLLGLEMAWGASKPLISFPINLFTIVYKKNVERLLFLYENYELWLIISSVQWDH